MHVSAVVVETHIKCHCATLFDKFETQSIFKLGKSYIAFNNCISNQKHNILLSFSPMYELKRNLLILKFYISDLDLFKFRQKYITVMVKCIFVMFYDQRTLYNKNKLKQDTYFLLFILFRKKICTHFSQMFQAFKMFFVATSNNTASTDDPKSAVMVRILTICDIILSITNQQYSRPLMIQFQKNMVNL